MSLPVVMSHIDRRVNHSSKKGKAKEEPSPRPESPSSAPPPSATEVEVDSTPADGVSDLAPAPTPEGLVPSPHLPSQPAPPRVAFTLPEGVDSIEECAIFYLGGESLALNNLLMTHGKCKVSVSKARLSKDDRLIRLLRSGVTMQLRKRPGWRAAKQTGCSCGGMLSLKRPRTPT